MCRKRFQIIQIFILLIGFHPLQAAVSGDSLLKEILTRGVLHWKEGKGKDAFLALDSITATPANAENAGTKIKAALWTAFYLQEQKKNRAAGPFLDSALSIARTYRLTEETKRVLEACSDWHLANGDAKTAMKLKEEAWKIQDSLVRASNKAQLDSMQALLGKNRKAAIVEDDPAAAEEKTDSTENNSFWKWLFGALSALILIILASRFLKKQPDKIQYTPPPADIRTGTANTSRVLIRKPETTADTIKTEPESRETVSGSEVPKTMPAREVLPKLRGVELVFIKAEILSGYQNGDLKSIRNLLNEYIAQLPFIMKTLDEAISKNEMAPILLSLDHVKTYLQCFGMQSTEKLILEVEAEAYTEKVSKLLSRVFQVRNNCRRAADEAKVLLERIG